MKPEELNSLKEEVIKATSETVERVVNGKINKIQETLNAHITEMGPFIDFTRFLNTLNRFLKWGGVTFFAFIAFIWFLLKKV